MLLKLYLHNVIGTDDQIADACAVGTAELARRHVSVQTAIDAVTRADEYSETSSTASSLDADSISAWYAAEYAAWERLNELTGQWPDQGMMVAIEIDANAPHQHLQSAGVGA